MKSLARTSILSLIILAAALWAVALPVSADPKPTSDLLLPYFEVDLDGGLTTLLAIVNSTHNTVTARISVFSNWGVEVVSEEVLFQPDKVRTINLSDWLIAGNFPGKQLRGGDLLHLQAALTGQASQKSGMYYSSPVKAGLAVGYIEIHVTSSPRHDALWGDYFVVDPQQDYAQGEILVNIDRSFDCSTLCMRRGLRFLTGGGFDGGTELVVWTGRRGVPSANGTFNSSTATLTKTEVYNEDGEHIDQRLMELRPVEVVTVAELGLTDPFGWLDMEADTEFFMTVRYSASQRFSVGLISHCLPIETCVGAGCGGDGGGENPRIDLEKATNGADADNAPGIRLTRGAGVQWTYRVTNTGDVPLTDVTVTDDDSSLFVNCPKSHLASGETMTCTASGSATAETYRNMGTATGTSPQGARVSDDDPSNYNTMTDPVPRILLEKYTNGADADNPPGIALQRNAAVTWTYVVTNTGETALSNVTVTDDDPGVTVSCPKNQLSIGETMTCSATGSATADYYRNVGTAVGTPPKGPKVSDDDPSHYYLQPDPQPRINIEKATNGHDADSAPGPQIETGDPVTWTYVVTNTGDVTLNNVSVTDDQGVAVSCPKTSLASGQSMTCTGNGTAIAGQYRNVGTAQGTSPSGTTVTDDDPSHYYGKDPEPAKLTLIKYVVNDDGGTAQVADFALFVGDQPVTSGVKNTFTPGTYQASEQNLPGYTAGNWGGDCDAQGWVTLAAGDDKTCTITNNDDPDICEILNPPSQSISNAAVNFNDPHKDSHYTEVKFDYQIQGAFDGEVQIFWKNGSSTYIKKRVTVDIECEDGGASGSLRWTSSSQSHHPGHGAKYFARFVIGGQVVQSIPLN